MLSLSETRMIQKLTEAIFPGANDARAYQFIERDMQSNPFLINMYQNGIKQLDQAALYAYHKGILELDGNQLNELLKNHENESFFQFLRDHTLEGVFSDPIYGGNYQVYGWRLIGYAGSRFYPPETLDEPKHPTLYYSLEGIAYEEKA